MKTTLNFGKIDYSGAGRRAYPVTVDIELRERGGNTSPVYTELSICGDIWNTKKTDIYCGGQCLDTINEYRDQLTEPELFTEIYSYWKKYHLNGMRAGTPEQETAVKEWEAAGNRYDYKAACDMLKERGLYEVNYTGLAVGKRYENEPYRYGCAWIIQEIPGDVLLRIEHIISANEEGKKK